jgi:hypothetical protein
VGGLAEAARDGEQIHANLLGGSANGLKPAGDSYWVANPVI